MLTWRIGTAEEHPGAEPGAKTGARAEHTGFIVDQHDSSGIGTDAINLRGTMPRSGPRCRSPFIYANRTKFHFTVNQDTDDSPANRCRVARRSLQGEMSTVSLGLRRRRSPVPLGVQHSEQIPDSAVDTICRPLPAMPAQ